MDNTLTRLYNMCPAFMQNTIISGYSILLDRERYGGKYKNYHDFLSETQWYSESDLIVYQENQLQKIINHAYDTVPYYKKIFQQRKLVPNDVKTLTDLHKIPILTKKDIKKNFNDLLSCSFNHANLKKGHTSGTTGSPLEICYDASVIYITYAALDRQYQWANVSLRRFGAKISVIPYSELK